MTALPPRPELERAVLRRDASYEGLFVFGVSTTGVFCRPTCPSRRARPEHLSFFAAAEDASAAGFRPCLRCRPLDACAPEPAWATELARRVEAEPDRRIRTADLRAMGLDPGTVRRHFRRRHGTTFQAYARARRLSGALDALRCGGSVDDAWATSGFESHSGFRTAFARLFGGPPGSRRDASCVVVALLESPLGPLVAGASDRGVCLLEFVDRRSLETQVRGLSARIGSPFVPGTHPHLDALSARLEEWFAGRRKDFDLPLDLRGTPFQLRVWSALTRIPYGETRSYSRLAAELGRPGAARAVGRANGANRVAIVVPCHRVVNEDGTLGGYGGGLRRKERLLALERSASAAPAGTLFADA